MQKKCFTLAELAVYTNSHLIGDPSYPICSVADLDSATSNDASFVANPRYEQAMRKSQAGVIFIDPVMDRVQDRNYLINENPSEAFQKVIEVFYDKQEDLSGFLHIHSTAIIHPSCAIGENVAIGPYAVIDKNSCIGEDMIIGAGCYIGPNTSIGSHCTLHPHVTIRERCTLGNRVILHPGVVIGSCGFGYITNQKGHHCKLNQVGIVVIEDDVEIGANTTIDRARFKSTHISKGTKIDNLVQIAHGVTIGEHTIIVAQTGIAGSTTIGKHVVLAGQSAVAGHLKISDGAIIAGRSAVYKSLTRAGKYGGIPAIPLNTHNRNTIHLRNIAQYVEQIKNLQERVEQLEKKAEEK